MFTITLTPPMIAGIICGILTIIVAIIMTKKDGAVAFFPVMIIGSVLSLCVICAVGVFIKIGEQKEIKQTEIAEIKQQKEIDQQKYQKYIQEHLQTLPPKWLKLVQYINDEYQPEEVKIEILSKLLVYKDELKEPLSPLPPISPGQYYAVLQSIPKEYKRLKSLIETRMQWLVEVNLELDEMLQRQTIVPDCCIANLAAKNANYQKIAGN